MSGVAIVNSLLSNDSGVGALVPAASVISGNLPIGIALPAISVRQISATRQRYVKQSAKILVTERVQVTVAAKDYDTQELVLKAVGAALPYMKATVAGFWVDGIIPDSDGPDIEDSVAQIFEGSRDFIVNYLE